MMPGRVARRYAQALFELAQAEGKTEAWEGELAALAEGLVATPEFAAVLTNPALPPARKEELLTGALGARMSREVLTLLLLLVRRGHAPDLRRIHAHYRALWDAARRQVSVTVTSAVALSEPEVEALRRTLAARLGATIELRREIDPELLAGLVLTIGDRVIDASARTTLARLRLALGAH